MRPGLECPPRGEMYGIRTWDDQLENDIWYVENVSLKTDLKLLIQLIRFTLNKENALVRSKSMRCDFMGYSKDGKAIGLEEVPDSYIDEAILFFEEESNK